MFAAKTLSKMVLPGLTFGGHFIIRIARQVFAVLDQENE